MLIDCKDELTPWFRPDVKPARKGVYLTRCNLGGGEWFQYWTGRRWSVIAFNPADAHEDRSRPSTVNQKPYWRGLAKESKKC